MFSYRKDAIARATASVLLLATTSFFAQADTGITPLISSGLGTVALLAMGALGVVIIRHRQ